MVRLDYTWFWVPNICSFKCACKLSNRKRCVEDKFSIHKHHFLQRSIGKSNIWMEFVNKYPFISPILYFSWFILVLWECHTIYFMIFILFPSSSQIHPIPYSLNLSLFFFNLSSMTGTDYIFLNVWPFLAHGWPTRGYTARVSYLEAGIGRGSVV